MARFRMVTDNGLTTATGLGLTDGIIEDVVQQTAEKLDGIKTDACRCCSTTGNLMRARLSLSAKRQNTPPDPYRRGELPLVLLGEQQQSMQNNNWTKV